MVLVPASLVSASLRGSLPRLESAIKIANRLKKPARSYPGLGSLGRTALPQTSEPVSRVLLRTMSTMHSAQVAEPKQHNDEHVESAHEEVWPNAITETDHPEKDVAAPRTDRHGLALIPQPSRFKDDPLVSQC